MRMHISGYIMGCDQRNDSVLVFLRYNIAFQGLVSIIGLGVRLRLAEDTRKLILNCCRSRLTNRCISKVKQVAHNHSSGICALCLNLFTFLVHLIALSSRNHLTELVFYELFAQVLLLFWCL